MNKQVEKNYPRLAKQLMKTTILPKKLNCFILSPSKIKRPERIAKKNDNK